MKTPGIFHSIVLATLLAVGIQAIWTTVVMIGQQMAEPRDWGVYKWQNLDFAHDGTPVLSVHEILEGRKHTTYRTPDGKTFQPPEKDAWLPTIGFGPLHETHSPIVEHPHRTSHTFRETNSIWHFVMGSKAEGSYFVGYDLTTKLPLGYLSRRGFTEKAPSTEERIPFSVVDPLSLSWHAGRLAVMNDPEKGGNVGHVASQVNGTRAYSSPSPGSIYLFGNDGKLYVVDFQKRTTRAILDQFTIRSIRELKAADERTSRFKGIVAAQTLDEILFLDGKDAIVDRWQLPREVKDEHFQFGITDSGNAIIWYVAFDPNKEAFTKVRMASPKGEIIRSEDINPYREWGYVPAPWLQDLTLSLPSPLLVDSFLALLWKTMAFSAAQHAEFRAAVPQLLILHVVSLAPALLAALRLRRFAAPRSHKIAWPLYVFLFGPFGYIGFRFCRSWPVLEKCPACHRLAPQDRTYCAHCKAEFPSPALEGTELVA